MKFLVFLISGVLFSSNVLAKTSASKSNVSKSSISRSEVTKINGLYLEAEKSVFTNRNYYIPEGESPKYNLNLGLKLDSGKLFYFDNKIVSTTNQSQFRFVGLESESGLSKFGVDLYLSHFSGHALDTATVRRFPQENVIGLRFNFIGDGRR